MRTWIGGTLLAVALLLSACAGGEAGPAERTSATDGADVARNGSSNEVRDDAGEGNGASSDGGSSDATDPSDVKSSTICARITAADVAAALDVASTEAKPSSSGTPQCTYLFESGGGIRSSATVSVLRTDEDLGGRRDKAAFDYVVDLNRSASGEAGRPTSKALEVGDEAVLLSGDALHMGIVRYGDRIVTTIVRAAAADATAAASLAEATRALEL